MRPIKFRAWSKSQKLMFHNVQNAYDTLRAHYPPEIENASDEERDRWCLYKNSFGDVLESNDFDVMQFTGLHDKNGKEIYEGDIVNYREDLPSMNERQKAIQGADMVQIDEVGIIQWTDSDASFDIHFKDYVRGFGARGDVTMEVLGNIHENPELVK